MSGRSNGRDGTRRVTMQQAADDLGLTVEAIRKRIQRGTLESDKGPDGRRYVYLTESHSEVQVEGAELVEELREQVRYLREQLDQEREARTEERRRHDTLLAQLMQRIPELEPPASPEPPGGAQRASGEEPKGAPGEGAAGSQEGAERSWWARWFGG